MTTSPNRRNVVASIGAASTWLGISPHCPRYASAIETIAFDGGQRAIAWQAARRAPTARPAQRPRKEYQWCAGSFPNDRLLAGILA
jgi:hypothetical protein